MSMGKALLSRSGVIWHNAVPNGRRCGLYRSYYSRSGNKPDTYSSVDL